MLQTELSHNQILSNTFSWIEKEALTLATKYRLQKLVLHSIYQGTEIFDFSKNELSSFLESTNRQTQKNFIEEMQKLGIIKIENEDHFRINFKLNISVMKEGNPVKKGSASANVVPFVGPKRKTGAPRQNNSVDRYNSLISDLMSEVTEKNNLERMAANETLRKAFYDRALNIRSRITTFEHKHGVRLDAQKSNLEAIIRIIESVKVFHAGAQTYEDKKRAKRLKMSPKSLVMYFYQQLSIKLGQPIFTSLWPTEIKAAKDVLRQMADRDVVFIRNYVDWTINTRAGITQMYSIRYYVPHYLQALEDDHFWKPLWEKYTERPRNTQGWIDPINENELGCLFTDLYQNVFGELYRPINSFQKDTFQLKELLRFLSHDFNKTVRYILWCLKNVFPDRKEKPSGPGDLYRFISSYVDTPPPVTPEVNKLQIILKRAAKRDTSFRLNEAEHAVVLKLIQTVDLSHLDDTTRQIIDANAHILRP